MGNQKQVVLLTGASGSMGFETFKLLWEKRDRYDIVLLLRPSKKNRKLFRHYIRLAMVPTLARAGSGLSAGTGHGAGAGSSAGRGLKIVWGDVLHREDVAEACRGIDWCLNPMALISPAADRDPEMAGKVNARGTRYLVEAIVAEDPEHIRLVHIGTIAEYGDRLAPVHVGRTGDPVIPSVYDHYALSKIKGELSVMQSRIKHRVSLRQTFMMIPGLFSLMDPIMFHQPINSFMENITARDSGRLMVRCLEMKDDSDFWGGYYNISGGPATRITYLEFLERIYGMLGIRYRKVMERNWFALKNFHMQFFEDSDRLNDYLHHWEGGQSMEAYFREVWKNLPWYLKATAWLARHFPPFRFLVEAVTRTQLRRLARKPDGTLGWIGRNDRGHIRAFYGSPEAFRKIPGWDKEMPSLDHRQSYIRLDHGYDERKEELDTGDLHQAALYRGGRLSTDSWNGDLHTSLPWECCRGHAFKMTPHAVLKGGHWCLECISPPWNYQDMAGNNLFTTQVLNLAGR
ncbi:MAG: NAD-dependent epimerase/dehydratase family protein [Bacteroidales bacterium]|nr:NAD-dependent epimerase/dehydratase family protein [Bacteroidales bacterium]